MLNITGFKNLSLLRMKEFRKLISIKSLITFSTLSLVCFLLSLITLFFSTPLLSGHTVAQASLPAISLLLGVIMLKAIESRLYVAMVSLKENDFIRGKTSTLTFN